MTIPLDKTVLPLASKDRNIQSISAQDISIAVGIRSMLTDFNMTQSSIKLDAPLEFKKAFYAPNHINKYLPAKYIYGTTIPEIAIGEGAKDGVDGGGTIDSNERYFSKFDYAAPTHLDPIRFNIELNVTYDVSKEQNNPQNFVFTTDKNKINAQNSYYQELVACPTSPVYRPLKGRFNIERTIVIITRQTVNPNYASLSIHR